MTRRETARPPQNWLQRIFSHFRPHRVITDGTEITIIGPISTRAIASAERALRWISKVPGGSNAQLRIGVALEMIKGLSVISAPDATTHDAKTLKWLEYHVRYLAELLEPFAQMHRSHISPLLQSEVLTLSRELETASSKIKPTASKEAPRWYSLHRPRREEHPRSASDVRAFTLDFKSALDQFRGNALPLYPISPIEATLLPLGVISNSSCALLPFMEWILRSERVMEHRIGIVRSVRLYFRGSAFEFSRPWQYEFILVGLENRRRIENWLKIELNASDARGTVVFGNTREALEEGIIGSYPFSLRTEEDTLPVTLFAREFQAFCTRHIRETHTLSLLIRDLRVRYRANTEPWNPPS